MNPNADCTPYIPQPLPDGETLCRMAAEAETFTCHHRNSLRALNYLYVTGEPEQFRFPFSEMRGQHGNGRQVPPPPPGRTCMKKPQLRYGAEITYRPVAPELVGDTPDSRPLNRLPWLCIAPEDTPEERERSLARSCRDLESQGYRIETVERVDACARCGGTGRISLKPRGWRRRTEPPLYMMRTVDCPDCAGERRKRTAIQPMLTDGLRQAVCTR